MKRAGFVGRWDTWHLGHDWLIDQKLEKGIPCVVFVRDVPPGPGKLLTTSQIVRIIETRMKGRDVIVQVIPDVESLNWGRGVGYEVNEHVPPENIGAVSATEIRRQLSEGRDTWKKYVDESIWHLIIEGLDPTF